MVAGLMMATVIQCRCCTMMRRMRTVFAPSSANVRILVRTTAGGTGQVRPVGNDDNTTMSCG